MSPVLKLLVPLYNQIGGHAITNSAYSNSNVTGLVYIAPYAPDEGQSVSNHIDLTKAPKNLLIFDNGGFPTKTLQFTKEPLFKMWIL